MSVYVVSTAQINALTQAMINENIITEHMAQDIGRDMLHLNETAYYVRYGEAPHEYETYTFRGTDVPLHPGVMIVACRSWMYQTCEMVDADRTPAWDRIKELEHALARRLRLDPESEYMAELDSRITRRGWDIQEIEDCYA